MLNIIGIKCGMTRLFLDSGISIPVTLIYIQENRIVNTYKINNNYYIQVTCGLNKKKINKSILGNFNKYNIFPGCILKSFKYKKDDFNENIKNIKKIISINDLLNFNMINVSGISKGKGFSGVIKRWNFKSQDSSHGNSLSHRAPGSIGQNQDPGRVFKGKKMAGHYGCDKITIKNLNIVKFNVNEKVVFVKGNIPGYYNNYVFVNFFKI